jgi:molybdopterin converting factor small subunit
MELSVRLNASLAHAIGASRLQLTAPDETTVAGLIQQLAAQYPALASNLRIAIPVVAGTQVPVTQVLQPGQEVAFLMPTAGGAHSLIDA